LLTLVWTRIKFNFARDGWFIMTILNYLPSCKNLVSSTLADNISQATTVSEQEEVVMVVVMVASHVPSSSHVLRGEPYWNSTHQCTIKDGWRIFERSYIGLCWNLRLVIEL
jgi:hypothetical protein